MATVEALQIVDPAAGRLLRCYHGDSVVLSLLFWPWRETIRCENTRQLRSVLDGSTPPESLTLQPHSPLNVPHPPGLISCGARPTLAPVEVGGERHPLTSSSIIRDGWEPLWVLSNSIQEFSQPVQSSLDKLNPPHPHPHSQTDLMWPLCCVLSHNPTGATLIPPLLLHKSSEKSWERKEK